MRNLHGIINGAVEGWFWFYMRGGNGRDIDHGTAHLFRLNRGTPPNLDDTIDEWNPRHRARFHPWRAQNMHVADAMCHRIPTRARWPQFYGAIVEQDPERNWLHINPICPNCLQLATMVGIQPMEHDRTIRNDPWNQLPGRNRYGVDWNPRWYEQQDPVTGV